MYQAVVLPSKGLCKNGNFRLGWSAKLGEMHGPVGMSTQFMRMLVSSGIHHQMHTVLFVW